MSELDDEIIQLAKRIQSLSDQPNDRDSAFFKLEKIKELVNAMIPRLEERTDDVRV